MKRSVSALRFFGGFLKTKKKIILTAVFLFLSAGLIIFDQMTKSLAVRHLKDQADILLIDGVLRLRYLENQGMAFGLLQGAQVFFFIATLVILSALCIFLFRLPTEKRFLPLGICGLLIFSGAIGNFIDRTFQKFVVDFIYFELIDFPIFNVADCYVTVGTIFLFFMLLFYYRDTDFERILPKRKKKTEDNRNDGNG